MTTRDVTTGSKLMTLFFILLAGRIIMNIKVISSLSLKILTCVAVACYIPASFSPQIQLLALLWHLCTVFTNPCWPETLQSSCSLSRNLSFNGHEEK